MSQCQPCVIDASVMIKLLIAEAYSMEALHIVRELLSSLTVEKTTIIVPDLLFIECANILWKRTARGELTAEHGHVQLQRLRAMNIPVAPMLLLAERAFDMACQYGISAYDAAYVALAERHNAILLTADERLRNRLQDSAYLVMTIPEYLTSS